MRRYISRLFGRGGCAPVTGFLALSLFGAGPGLLNAQTVQGRTVAFEGDEAIEGVTIDLLGGEEGDGVVASGFTDENGGFRFVAPASGSYRLRARRIGYQTVVTPAFDLVRDEDPLEVEVLMAVEAVPLAPLIVVSDRPARLSDLRLHLRGFHERRRTWGKEGMGFGHFLDREDIDRRNAFAVMDLLRGIPGVRVEGAGGRHLRVLFRSSVRSFQERCIPNVYVDGVLLTSGTGDESIEALVSVQDLAGVEVYPGLTQPGEFSRGRLCGSLVLWTGASGR